MSARKLGGRGRQLTYRENLEISGSRMNRVFLCFISLSFSKEAINLSAAILFLSFSLQILLLVISDHDSRCEY